MNLKHVIFIFSLIYFSISVFYYVTGEMGTEFWVLVTVPLAFALYTLYKLSENKLYPRLGKFQYLIAATYILICLSVAIYFSSNYMELVYYRAGNPTFLDYLFGTLIFLLVLEYSRREHKVLFGLAIFLIFYTLYGYIFPGILWHTGISLERIITSATIEIKLGIFGTYAQMGTGLIGAFLLLIGIAEGFGINRSLIKTIIFSLGKKPELIPQTTVVSSAAIGMCTGSGAAGCALLGQFSIPAMTRAGFPPIHAASTLGAAMLGALIMPPVMAIAAFLMVEFLGVTYFEVMIRGFVVAAVYFLSIGITVYYLTLRYISTKKVETRAEEATKVFGELTKLDKTYSIVFISCIAILIYLMGGLWWPEVRAAVTSAFILLLVASVLHLAMGGGSNAREKIVSLLRNIKAGIEAYPRILVDIMLLLAVLGIIIDLFTVTGWLLKLGMLLTSIGRESVILLILVAFLFGYFLGFGMPPSAVYIITAVLAAPALINFGFNPWVAHFFIFLVATISEFTPPVALISAITSRMAGTPFVKTALVQQVWILPLYLMIFAVLTRPELVVKPGFEQLVAMVLVMIGCVTVTTGAFGKFSNRILIDAPIRVFSIAIGPLILFYPNVTLAYLLAPIGVLLTIIALRRTAKVAA